MCYAKADFKSESCLASFARCIACNVRNNPRPVSRRLLRLSVTYIAKIFVEEFNISVDGL